MPRPGTECMGRLPSEGLTCSRMLFSPNPGNVLSGSKPTPEPLTDKERPDSSPLSVTNTLPPLACLATLCKLRWSDWEES